MQGSSSNLKCVYVFIKHFSPDWFFHTLSPRYTQLTNCLLGRIFRNNALYQMSNIDKRIRDPDERITQEVQVRSYLLLLHSA